LAVGEDAVTQVEGVGHDELRGAKGVTRIVTPTAPERKRETENALDLSACDIGDEGAFALAESPLLDRLKGSDGLKLRGNRFSEEANRRLKEPLGYDPQRLY